MKQRNHIDSKTLARAAKWSKPKLRKKYTYKPKKMTVSKYLKHSNDSKLQRRYSKYLKKSSFKSTSHNDDENTKVYNKFESKNNFATLKQQNMEFAMNKNKQHKLKRLKKLDNLAWESIAIPANDTVFGSMDGIGNECGVGSLQVMDSKDFFNNVNINDLHVEEYVLDNNYYKHNDNIGIKGELNINQFNNEANELLTLIEFSANKMNKQQINKKNKKRLQKKTMKEKAEAKRLRMLEKRYGESMLIKTQDEIDERLLDLLGITINSIQKELKTKMKMKAKGNKMRKLEAENGNDNNNKEPPMKKRKLNVKQCEFRHQMNNLHEKQNIKQISKNWNALLMSDQKCMNNNGNGNDELMAQLNTLKTRMDMINIVSNDELNNYLQKCEKLLVVLMFVNENIKLDNISSKNDGVDFVKIDVNKMDDDIRKRWRINNNEEILVFVNGTNGKELKRMKRNVWNNESNILNELLSNLNNSQKQMLHKLLLKGVADLGFISPTRIQKEVIPIGVNGMNDVLISAATGSGKTLSFGIPIINDLMHNNNLLDSYLYGLIITPTRELAIQIESHLQLLCKYSSISCGLIIGGMSLLKQQRILKSSPEIIIGTPGRIWNLMSDKIGSSIHLRNLIKLRYLVLDEADKLLCSKHYKQVHYILNVIKNIWNINKYKYKFNNDNLMQFLEEEKEEKLQLQKLPFRRQTFIVSATLTLESINRNKITESKSPIFANLATLVPFQESIKIIDQTPRHRTTLNVCEYEILLDINDKDAMIIYLLLYFAEKENNKGKILIFANTIGCVKRILLILKEFGYMKNIYSIHSQQQQKQRLKNLDKFVKLNNCVLICTDVCARGLDIINIKNIIHFQCPLSPEDYIHRVGRIGRHENTASATDGNSFLLISANEMKLYEKIILALKKPQGLNKLILNERLFIQIKKQISIVKKIASLLNNTIRKNRRQSNLQKMADAAGIELDEINCKALNIMKTDNNLRNDKQNRKKKYSKKNKHNSFEYGVVDNNNQINNEIKVLRNQLKELKRNNDLKTPKSSYYTKRFGQ